jgi:hypothetical protein
MVSPKGDHDFAFIAGVGTWSSFGVTMPPAMPATQTSDHPTDEEQIGNA